MGHIYSKNEIKIYIKNTLTYKLMILFTILSFLVKLKINYVRKVKLINIKNSLIYVIS